MLLAATFNLLGYLFQPFLGGPWAESVGKLLLYLLHVLLGELEPAVVGVSLMTTWAFLWQPTLAPFFSVEDLLNVVQ